LFDPVREKVLYTNDLKNGGLVHSSNSGRTWKPIENVPPVRFIDACFDVSQPNGQVPERKTTLFLGTFGGGMLQVSFD